MSTAETTEPKPAAVMPIPADSIAADLYVVMEALREPGERPSIEVSIRTRDAGMSSYDQNALRALARSIRGAGR